MRFNRKNNLCIGHLVDLLKRFLQVTLACSCRNECATLIEAILHVHILEVRCGCFKARNGISLTVNVVCRIVNTAKSGNSRQQIRYTFGILTVNFTLVLVAKNNARFSCLRDKNLHAANDFIAVLVKLVLLNKKAEDTHTFCTKYFANVKRAAEELQVGLKIVGDFIFSDGRTERRNDNALFIKATLDFGKLLVRFCNNGTKIHSTGLDAKESVSLECLNLSVNTVVCFICKSGDQKFCHSNCPFVFIRP